MRFERCHNVRTDRSEARPVQLASDSPPHPRITNSTCALGANFDVTLQGIAMIETSPNHHRKRKFGKTLKVTRLEEHAQKELKKTFIPVSAERSASCDRYQLDERMTSTKSPLGVPPHPVEREFARDPRQTSMGRRRDAEREVESTLAIITPRQSELATKYLRQETGRDELVCRSKGNPQNPGQEVQ